MRCAFILIACLCLVGCQAAPIRPVEGSVAADQLSSKERRLWHVANDFDEGLQKGGHIFADDGLQEYAQSVMDRLYPEYGGSIKVRVIDSPSLNAFALPNGSIYINTGMLARLDNEAQMATVLAHEGIHFTNRHGWRQRRTLMASTSLATGFNIVTGIPLLGDLMAVSSIYGFSQELEREADVEGYKRLQNAGYDVSQSPVAFAHLLAEVEALEIDEPYFFSTHPSLRDRIQNFEELIRQSSPKSEYRAKDRYLSQVDELRYLLLEDYLQMGQYQSVLLILEREGAFTRYSPRARFYLGEAYRLRDKEGDRDRALEAYEAAVAQAPDFAPPYRALGMHHMKNNNVKPAVSFFSRYLELDSSAPDRGYIEQYLTNLRKSGEQ